MSTITSPFPPVPISDKTMTQRVFDGIDPDMTILVDGPSGRPMTGAEFIAAVKSLAGGLNAAGLGAGKCVAIMAPNLPEYCVVAHGVAWAGGTITTINPTYTAPEVAYQLADAGADLLITVAPFADIATQAARGTGVQDIVVIGEAPPGTTPLSALMGPAQDTQTPVDAANHVVALPYSSGTTGLPKGVMLTHRNLVVNISQMLAPADVDAGELTLAFLPFFHIYGLQVLMNVYLAAGGGLVTMPRFDLEMFLELACKYRTRRLWVVPPVALALAKHPVVDTYDLSHVEQVFSAAAPLGGDVAEALATRLGTTVAQGYGMTELSPASHISPGGKGKPGASGVTVPNTECRIINPDTGASLAPTDTGELLVRGPQVMKGYLNNPDATAETIDPDGWLHTGDIGRFDEDGFLYLTDRVKELIKVKGFQVAPAELEATLLAHPAVTDAAVIGVPDDASGEVPMAFVAAAAGNAPSLQDIQAFFEGRLAHYKQIRHLRVVETVPKSPSGKILRRQLRDEIGI